MEPEGSLPPLQDPTICPHPEPDQSSPCSPSHFLKIHLNIILPSTLGSRKWTLALRFPHQTPVHASPILHTRHMPRPSQSSWFYHSQNIRWGLAFPPLLCYLTLLGPNILLNTLFSNTLSLCSSLNVSDQVSYPYKTTGKIIVLYILNFKCLDSNLEDKRFCSEW